MNGYTSKPINPRALLDAVAGAIRPRSARPAPPPIRLDELTHRCMNNPAMAARLLERLEAELPRDLAQLEQHAATGALSALARSAHALRGAASLMAANDLAVAAQALEESAGASGPSSLDAVRREIGRCLEWLPTARALLNSPTQA